MYPCGNDAGVEQRHFFKRISIVTRNDFKDLCEGMFFIPWIDALWTIADMKILPPFRAGGLFKNGNTNFFSSTGVEPAAS